MRIMLRAAEPCDVEAIATVWCTGWADAHDHDASPELRASRTAASFHRRAAANVPRTTVAHTAGDDREVAGFVVVNDDEVEQLYVAPAHRSTTLAASLLAVAEDQIRHAGHASAWLAVTNGNQRARRFYGRHGWDDTGLVAYSAEADAHTADTVSVQAHRYEKPLHLPR